MISCTEWPTRSDGAFERSPAHRDVKGFNETSAKRKRQHRAPLGNPALSLQTLVTEPFWSSGFGFVVSATEGAVRMIRLFCAVVLWPLPSFEPLRVHASVRDQRGGRQHEAGSVQARCAHLVGVLDVGSATVRSTTSSEPRPREPRRQRSGRQRWRTQFVRPHEARRCLSGSRYHQPTAGAGSH